MYIEKSSAFGHVEQVSLSAFSEQKSQLCLDSDYVNLYKIQLPTD